MTARSGVSAVADGELLVEDEVPSKELVESSGSRLLNKRSRILLHW